MTDVGLPSCTSDTPLIHPFHPNLEAAIEDLKGGHLESITMFGQELCNQRSAYLQLPPKYRNAPMIAAFLNNITTPLGIALGFGASSSGFVELLAHEFLFSRELRETHGPPRQVGSKHFGMA
ncbi:hypothetical protein V8E53_015142 [Lactarius tabidus]